MTVTLASGRPARPARIATTFRRRVMPSGRRTLGWLAVLALVVAAVTWVWPVDTPIVMIVLPMLLGSLLLGPRQLPWFVLFTLALLLTSLARQPQITPRLLWSVAVLFVAGLIILVTSYRRTRLGVGGAQGEAMLVDLRDRIQGQSIIPDLPAEWAAESSLRSAGGTPFAGDFVVACRPSGSSRMEVAVVDVSGKGEAAGTRALLLSGAFGGLLGALPPH